ncbi:hypothetical protein JW992_03715, partial [candidate division KSB1 bacterium]|nr:hypothetical protein [candidate division KSB1 bacterium]
LACGSCWAFSAVAAWESRMLLAIGNPTLVIDKSEQFVLSCSDGTCAGWNVAGATQFIYTTGCPEESCFPYGPPYDARPCGDACSNWQESAEKISSGCYLVLNAVPTAAEVEAIKTALLDGPIAASMDVYEDFQSYGGGIYQYTSGDNLGGHGITLVGWDDASSPPSWICKNSWGTNWGESGFFRIAQGEATSRIGRHAYQIEHFHAQGKYQLSYVDKLNEVAVGLGSSTTIFGGAFFTSTDAGYLTAVATRFTEMGMDYTVRVYDTFNGSTPSTLLGTSSGSFGNTFGWKQLRLDTPIPIGTNDDFFISIEYSGSLHGLPIESTDAADNSGSTYYSGNGSTFYPMPTNDPEFGDGCITAEIESEITVHLRAFLQGYYCAGGDTMRLDLKRASLLPLTSPYDATSAVAVPDSAVDWVRVELRSAADGSTVAGASCWLSKNGFLCSADGTPGLPLPYYSGDFYVVVKHRNHLAIMSQNPVALGNTEATVYDFSAAGSCYGTNGCASLANGRYGCWAGDTNDDQSVDATDFNAWSSQAQSDGSGYIQQDFNGDGRTTTRDYTLWYNSFTAGAVSQVP